MFFSWWKELFVAMMRGEKKRMIKETGSKGTGQNFLPEFLLLAEK